MFVKGAPVNSFCAVAVCGSGRYIDGLQVDFLLGVGLGMHSGRKGRKEGRSGLWALNQFLGKLVFTEKGS